MFVIKRVISRVFLSTNKSKKIININNLIYSENPLNECEKIHNNNNLVENPENSLNECEKPYIIYSKKTHFENPENPLNECEKPYIDNLHNKRY